MQTESCRTLHRSSLPLSKHVTLSSQSAWSFLWWINDEADILFSSRLSPQHTTLSIPLCFPSSAPCAFSGWVSSSPAADVKPVSLTATKRQNHGNTFLQKTILVVIISVLIKQHGNILCKANLSVVWQRSFWGACRFAYSQNHLLWSGRVVIWYHLAHGASSFPRYSRSQWVSRLAEKVEVCSLPPAAHPTAHSGCSITTLSYSVKAFLINNQGQCQEFKFPGVGSQ